MPRCWCWPCCWLVQCSRRRCASRPCKGSSAAVRADASSAAAPKTAPTIHPHCGSMEYRNARYVEKRSGETAWHLHTHSEGGSATSTIRAKPPSCWATRSRAGPSPTTPRTTRSCSTGATRSGRPSFPTEVERELWHRQVELLTALSETTQAVDLFDLTLILQATTEEAPFYARVDATSARRATASRPGPSTAGSCGGPCSRREGGFRASLWPAGRPLSRERVGSTADRDVGHVGLRGEFDIQVRASSGPGPDRRPLVNLNEVNGT